MLDRKDRVFVQALSLLQDNDDILISLYSFAAQEKKYIDIKLHPENGFLCEQISFTSGEKRISIASKELTNIQSSDDKVAILSKILDELFYV